MSEAYQRRAETDRRIGFEAYGATRDMPDPVANAINAILDHVHHTDARLQEMCTALRALGAQVNDSEIPDLEHCSIDENSPGERTSSADKG